MYNWLYKRQQNFYPYLQLNTPKHNWLRHCITRWKVAVWIPYDVSLEIYIGTILPVAIRLLVRLSFQKKRVLETFPLGLNASGFWADELPIFIC